VGDRHGIPNAEGNVRDEDDIPVEGNDGKGMTYLVLMLV
jgi:hypothetical protein